MVGDFSQPTTARGPLQFAKIEVYGKVQGVNFRQMVKQIAMEKELCGQVENNEKNQRLVHIHIEGSKSSIDDLIAEIEQMKPKPLDHPYLKGWKYYIKTEKVLVSERYPIENSKRHFSLFEVNLSIGNFSDYVRNSMMTYGFELFFAILFHKCPAVYFLVIVRDCLVF